MHGLREFIEDEPQKALMIGALGFAIFIGSINYFSPSNVATRRELAATDKISIREKVERDQLQRHLDQSAADAELRFQKGCRLVTSADEFNRPISINEGMLIVDLVTNQPLADNTVVCTVNGETAVIKDGKTSNISITGDRNVVQQAIESGRAN
jgi:hypothetical protein